MKTGLHGDMLKHGMLPYYFSRYSWMNATVA